MGKLYFICSLFLLLSCFNKIYVDDFVNKPYKYKYQDIKELNLNEAYYQVDENKKLDVYFFYDNYLQRSITIDSSNYNIASISSSINKIIGEYNNAGRKSDQYFEDGGYSISNSEITIQSVRYVSQFVWSIVTYKGKVVNDSTILFTEFKFPKKNIVRNDSLYYHFIKTNKPGSLRGNRWKNKDWFWQ